MLAPRLEPCRRAKSLLPSLPCGTVRGPPIRALGNGWLANLMASGHRLHSALPSPPLSSAISFLVHLILYRLIYPVFGHLQSHRILRDRPWKGREKKRRRKGVRGTVTTVLRSELTQSGASDTLRCSDRMPLNERSIQDALRKFFQPIKNDDSRLDFYTMYKREATEYDTDYVKKYDEDLNTTLIFVGLVSFTPASHSDSSV